LFRKQLPRVTTPHPRCNKCGCYVGSQDKQQGTS
jgi:hypothetical protein